MKIHAWASYPLPKAVKCFSNSLWMLVTHEERPQFVFFRSIIVVLRKSFCADRVPWIKGLLKDLAFVKYSSSNIQKNPSVETIHYFKILVLGQMQEMIQMFDFLCLVSETQKIQVFEEEHNIFVFQNELCFCTFQHILKHSLCTDRHHCSHFFRWPEVPVVRLCTTEFLFALSILCVSLQGSFTSCPHLTDT